MGKNNAPVSLTVRRTSDKTSTLADSRAAAGGGRLTAAESVRAARILDARADNADDPSWRLATARSYIRRVSPEGALATAPVRTMWALGDYHRFARATVWELGPLLVSACKIFAGQRVLDVAAGTGNVAIRAAQAGASVVASDLTPENFDAGRRAAREAGVELEWVEGDAAALPFADAEFDAVTSCFGAMFAADHQAVASELLRVCRPGGTIGMMNFTPDGAGQDFFRVLSAYAPPPPPSALPPLLWGTEEHVRKLFGEGIQSLKTTRREYVETASSPREYFELFKHAFGPMVAIYASLNDQPERIAELDARFLQFIARWNRGKSEDRVRMPYEYLLVITRKRDLA